MRGRHHIRVANRAVSYDFTLIRNITVLQGDSATGKTTLVGMIRDYEENGADSAVSLSSDRPCAVIGGRGWESQLERLDRESIVFIDEGNRFVASRDFAAAIQGSGHYFVIVTREPLYNLPYSVTEIYGIHSSGKYNSLEPVHHGFHRIYSVQEPAANAARGVSTILTEDGNAGFQFFSHTCRSGVSCETAGGNSNIMPTLEGDWWVRVLWLFGFVERDHPQQCDGDWRACVLWLFGFDERHHC